jgi:diguanylate cyclase (GGDEF)-like protein/putative nucleotidyltransferase with HDIG domain
VEGWPNLSGRSRRVGRGALLLPLAYAATLSLLGLSAVAVAVLDAEHATSTGVAATLAADQAIVREFAATQLTAAEVGSGAVEPARRAEIQQALVSLARVHGYLDVTLLTAGRNVLVDGGTGLGLPVESAGIKEFVQSGAGATIITSEPSAESPGSPVLAEALRVLGPGEGGLVLLIQRDAAPVLLAARSSWQDTALVTLGGAVVLAGLVYLLFGAASTRLRRQEARLAEAQRRDPLTGLLNHATGVTMLTELMEVNRASGESIGIAIVDVDNFRMLNDIHGSPAGDEVLIHVANALRGESGSWAGLARYGPDEFLAIAVGPAARELELCLTRARETLELVGVRPEGSERLPITVSIGISYFPFHAASVIQLVSAATIAIGEAKSAGGNRIEIANAWSAEPREPHTTFDVLRGLVLAIDRKDRYTRVHSEDVASYALFLARRIGSDEDLLAAIRVAALLHDVGKIGIPDEILRKPGRMTPHEYEIVKQHVTLGDLIVRDLPDIETVRAGVRHHHERWDGTGYVDGLGGEEIPLIARILAVADAFSAMTTSRPYRKALRADEALEELTAGRATQFDAHLVDAFVAGIQYDPTAPLPGSDRDTEGLWTPSTRAA